MTQLPSIVLPSVQEQYNGCNPNHRNANNHMGAVVRLQGSGLMLYGLCHRLVCPYCLRKAVLRPEATNNRFHSINLIKSGVCVT
jgi:hypothetical protein